MKSKTYVAMTDIFHMFLGVLTMLSAKYNTILSLVFPFNTSIAIPFIFISIYIAYQVFDDDPPEERMIDLMEYALGMILGLGL